MLFTPLQVNNLPFLSFFIGTRHLLILFDCKISDFLANIKNMRGKVHFFILLFGGY